MKDIHVNGGENVSAKTFKQKFIMEYQKQNFKQDIRTIRNPSITKRQMTRNYRMNFAKLKLQKKASLSVGDFRRMPIIKC